jgi:hypothetical protein
LRLRSSSFRGDAGNSHPVITITGAAAAKTLSDCFCVQRVAFESKNRQQLPVAKTASQLLVIGICRGYHEFFSFCAKDGLLSVVGPIWKGSHLDVEGDRVLSFIEVGVNVQ